MPYQMGDVLRTTREAGRLATVVDLRVHHGRSKCPVDGPCEHAVSYQFSLLYPTFLARFPVWIACLGRTPFGYVPEGTRIATLTMPEGTQWGIISKKGPPELYLEGPQINEEWAHLWDGFPAAYLAR
jgi:hypothetical protein